MASPGSGSTEAAATRSDALVWCAFLVAFSPLALDLFGHLRLRPWASYGLLFAVILVLRARSEPAHAAPRRDGYVLLLVALALQGMAVGAGFARWGRLALPLGVFGLARALGRPSPRVAALSFWAVPVPTFVAVDSEPGARGAVAPCFGGHRGSCGAGLGGGNGGDDGRGKPRPRSRRRRRSPRSAPLGSRLGRSARRMAWDLACAPPVCPLGPRSVPPAGAGGDDRPRARCRGLAGPREGMAILRRLSRRCRCRARLPCRAAAEAA